MDSSPPSLFPSGRSKTGIRCRFENPPQDAVRRVYEACGLRFVSPDEPWELYRPSMRRENMTDLASITSAAGRWVEAIGGNEVLASRVGVWRYAVAALGIERATQMMPETFLLDDDDDVNRLRQIGAGETFLLKGRGHRRQAIRQVDGSKDTLAQSDGFLVAQRLVRDQLRYRDTIFHLRCYLLLTLDHSVLNAWMFEDAVCDWAIPSSAATDEFQRWVTRPDSQVEALPEHYPRSLYELCDSLGLNFETIWWNIAHRFVGIVTTCSPALGRVESLQDATCFQHFGVDIIVKEDLTPLICEINRGPVMDAKCPRYAAIKDKVLRDGLAVAGLTGETDHGFVQLLEIQP